MGDDAVDLDQVQAVLFDMDGTLVDSDAVVERSWRAWAARYGVDPDALLTFAHGMPAEATVRRFLPGRSDAEIALAARSQLAVEYDDVDGIVATDGAHDLLAVLDKLDIPWAIVTSADTPLTAVRLAAAGIEPPAVVITRDDVTSGKPDPEGYLAAARLLAVAPADTLVVEDSLPGVAAGRAAGARVAALKGVNGDLGIASLRDLTEPFLTRQARISR